MKMIGKLSRLLFISAAALGLLGASAALGAPTTPAITFPANNSVLTSAHLTHIDWTDSTGTGTLTYQYQAWSNSDYTGFIYDSGFSLSASEILSPGTPLGVYYVRVRAQDVVGQSDWSNGPDDPYKITVAANDGLGDLSPAQMWIGLKNSDDVGTQFDLLAEVLINGSLVGSGELDGVNGGSSGFNHAVNRSIALALLGSPAAESGDTLTFTLSVRISTAVSGHRSGTARLWYNDVPANSQFDATIGATNKDYFLQGTAPTLTLGNSAGLGPKKTIDVFVDKLVGGNPFKPFGTWSITIP